MILALKTLEPKLDLFSFSSPDPEHIYLFLEDEKGNRFGTRSASDGTMRFLGITCVILTAEEAVTDKFPPPLIVLEEPENGLYVGQLKPLIERIDPLCSNGQFVFTSHSPYFMDLFDGQLEGVNLIKPGVPSSTIARINTDKIRGLLKEMSLGEMHFRELLA